MHCVRCGKPLTKFAVSIPTAAGPVGWGPVCARTVVIKPTSTLYPAVEATTRRVRAVPADSNQLELLEMQA